MKSRIEISYLTTQSFNKKEHADEEDPCTVEKRYQHNGMLGLIARKRCAALLVARESLRGLLGSRGELVGNPQNRSAQARCSSLAKAAKDGSRDFRRTCRLWLVLFVGGKWCF